jgi:hypothetical protein
MYLQRHTLPYFIPAEAIAAATLSTDVLGFTETVADYANAYISRREQARELGDEATALASPAFDAVELRLPRTETVVRLEYGLLDTRPATVVATDARVVEAFQRHSLAEALAMI